ncbi:EAL domain-containing protein [Demequina sp.]|uniref:EAL domain-containing protein n=1 Tax=Demequina sp. TaxID=2050685 RepID=UPI003D11003E
MGAPRPRVLVGRQGIFTAARELVAYELLFRTPGRAGLRIDLWNQRQQDRATEHVIAAALCQGPEIAPELPVSINFTRSYLVSHDDLQCDPSKVIVEVVESAFADDALKERMARLCEQGFRIGLDDFIGTRSQMDLLEHAEFVKVDYRDLTARGPELVDRARSAGAQLVAERIETREALDECLALGFDFFQGHAFEPAILVDRGEFEPGYVEDFVGV